MLIFKYTDWALTYLALDVVIIVWQFVKDAEILLGVDFSLLLACLFKRPIASPLVLFHLSSALWTPDRAQLRA